MKFPERTPETPEEWDALIQKTCKAFMIITDAKAVGLFVLGAPWLDGGEGSAGGMAGASEANFLEVAELMRQTAKSLVDNATRIMASGRSPGPPIKLETEKTDEPQN